MEGKKYGYIIGGIAVLVIVIMVFYLYNGNSSNNTVNSANTTGEKFSDSKYYKNSYLISGETLSTQAQTALSGFSYSKTVNADGSITITLKAFNPEYKDQSYTLKAGQQLYFIENSFGDDSPPNGENSLQDDHAVLVDSNGNIISAE
jgi:hypothetical protein